ncbi:MAG: hypothetical protein SX243_23940 [Acidobacteriota bacterium]|nr:hypothetical protein [Acidobacteriota bacterium]
MTPRSTALTHPLWFLLPLAGVYAVAWYCRGLLHQPGGDALALGVTLDLVILVPAVYGWVMVRGRGWPVLSLGPVILASAIAAGWLLPVEHHDTLELLGALVPVLELGLLGYVGYRAWGLWRGASEAWKQSSGDFFDRCRWLFRRILPSPTVAGVLAYEVAVGYYLLSPRKKSSALDPAAGNEPGPETFSYHRRCGYGAILAGLMVAGVGELAALHFLLVRWHPAAAWVHFALAGYGLIWLLGDYRAILRRPLELSEAGLRLRCGIRWNGQVRWDQIADWEILSWRDEVPVGKNYRSLAVFGRPHYLLRLKEPAELTGPYGLRQQVRCIGLEVDDRQRFEEVLSRRVG